MKRTVDDLSGVTPKKNRIEGNSLFQTNEPSIVKQEEQSDQEPNQNNEEERPNVALFKVGMSQKGGYVLWHEGFRFLRKRIRRQTIDWQCDNYRFTRCQVRARTSTDDLSTGEIYPSCGAEAHNHQLADRPMMAEAEFVPAEHCNPTSSAASIAAFSEQIHKLPLPILNGPPVNMPYASGSTFNPPIPLFSACSGSAQMSSSNASAKNSRYGQHSHDPRKPMIARMLDGELYQASDPTLQASLNKNEFWLSRFNASLGLPWEERNHILRERLGALGKNSTIRPPFFCDYGSNLFLGSNVFLNFNCCVLDVCRVDIGDNTQIGPSVQIYAADHPRDKKTRDQGWEFGKPVWIGRNVWVGGGAIIMPGVHVGDDAIIGAGAIVTRDVPKGITVVGNPARPISTNDKN